MADAARLVNCPDCGGSGEHRGVHSNDWDEPFYGENWKVTRSTCGGSGEISDPDVGPRAARQTPQLEQ